LLTPPALGKHPQRVRAQKQNQTQQHPRHGVSPAPTTEAPRPMIRKR
jgi:hypothetical protein